MFVRWKRRRQPGAVWTAQLVESSRHVGASERGQPRQRVLATLGSFHPDWPDSEMALFERWAFWARVELRLALFTFLPEELAPLVATLSLTVPRLTASENRRASAQMAHGVEQ